jgi:hypothetical protein
MHASCMCGPMKYLPDSHHHRDTCILINQLMCIRDRCRGRPAGTIIIERWAGHQGKDWELTPAPLSSRRSRASRAAYKIAIKKCKSTTKGDRYCSTKTNNTVHLSFFFDRNTVHLCCGYGNIEFAISHALFRLISTQFNHFVLHMRCCSCLFKCNLALNLCFLNFSGSQRMGEAFHCY